MRSAALFTRACCVPRAAIATRLSCAYAAVICQRRRMRAAARVRFLPPLDAGAAASAERYARC